MKDVTKKMNAVIIHIEIDITQTKKIAMTAALWIKSDITNMRRTINRLEKERHGETGGKGKRKTEELNAKYRVKKKGINLVIE